MSDSNASGTFGRAVGYQRVIGVDGQYRTVPICPDIKMKELPFYDILAVLIRPTRLVFSLLLINYVNEWETKNVFWYWQFAESRTKS